MRGKVRTLPVVVGAYDLKFDPVVFVPGGGVAVKAAFICSQLYKSVLPSASLPVAVNVNGVTTGKW